MKDFILIILFLPWTISWNFESKLEANIKDVISLSHLCLGECLNSQCVYDWHNNIAPCETTTTPTKRYTTLDNKVCLSNCDVYNFESYQWCVTGTNNWGKCSRGIALKAKWKYTTENIYLTCSNDCGEYGYSYNWCETVTKSPQCNLDEKVLVPNYPTIINTECATLCKLYGDEPYCYDTSGIWLQCFLNPKYDHVLFEITNKLKKNCRFGSYNANGYKQCKKISERNLDFHECDLDVHAIAERHRLNNPSDLVRSMDFSTPITLDRDPTLSYTTLPRRGRFGNTNADEEVDLPLVYEALLTTHTLLPVGARREIFRDYVTRNYNRMSPNGRDIANYDERGHILGSRLGGPMEPFNIFPQTWRLNRGRGSTWFEMETHLDRFLRGYHNRYVEFLAVLGYITDRNGILIRRPDHVGIRLRFHEDNYLVDRDGNRLYSFDDNETEDMFFSNDPDDDCILDVAYNS